MIDLDIKPKNASRDIVKSSQNRETESIKKGNILRIGVCSLDELEDKVKAYRIMNQTSRIKRFVVSREVIQNESGQVLIDKAEDIDISKVLLLRRFKKNGSEIKTFSPDEGVVIVSDMNSAKGIQLSMDLVTQIMNIGAGSYEAFIDRVDSISELMESYGKGLFPKLIILGYLEPGKEKLELLKFATLKKLDPHLRIIEVSHSTIKPTPYLPRVTQVPIIMGDIKSWQRFVLEIISEYTKPYFSENLI